MSWKLLLLWLLLAASAPGHAHFAMPQPVPVERLAANARAYVAAHPQEAQGHYLLARIHYLAFALQSQEVPAFTYEPLPAAGAAALPNLPPDPLVMHPVLPQRSQQAIADVLARWELPDVRAVPPARNREFQAAVQARTEELKRSCWAPATLPVATMTEHARLADASFAKALELAPDNALYTLGQASLRRQVLDWAASVGAEPPLPGLAGAAVREQFYRAFTLARRQDLRLKERPLQGLGSLVSYEAGKAYLELAAGPDDKAAAARRQEVTEALAKLDKLRFGAITPIVFSLAAGRRLNQLLDPATCVDFDLDGDGRAETRPWLRPDTGLLVWDPAGRGQIDSGRQLFGSVTWWLFPPDGYRALDLLDDDRDGELTGAELAGIRAWFDRNADGRAGPGEVCDLSACGIAALAVRPDGSEDGCLRAARGLRLADGRYLPTWDWLAPAVAAPLWSLAPARP